MLNIGNTVRPTGGRTKSLLPSWHKLNDEECRAAVSVEARGFSKSAVNELTNRFWTSGVQVRKRTDA